MMDLFVRVFTKSNRQTIIPIMYFIGGLIIGNFTLLALFTGILLQGFINNDPQASEKSGDQLTQS